MLFLQLPAVSGAQTPPKPLPIGEATALALERALLAASDAERLSEVGAALADPNAMAWAIGTVEYRIGRTVNRVAEAAGWLSECLELELAGALRVVVPPATDLTPSMIEWRLPRLAARLANCARRLNEFDLRLEHEKLESLKELAYGASHEVNNPLANIAARAQTLLEEESDPERQRKLAAIHRQAMRAHEMISDLMLFARPPKLRKASCDLGQLVRRVVDEVATLAEERETKVVCECSAETLQVRADETQLAVAIGAIIKNALEAAGNGGNVQVTVRRQPDHAGQLAEVLIRDDGPGISDEVRRHLFDPFYSGREAGRGLGFGASKCWRIVTDHGGHVIVRRPPVGAEVAIQMPTHDASTASS